jgi:hypothetical protein
MYVPVHAAASYAMFLAVWVSKCDKAVNRFGNTVNVKGSTSLRKNDAMNVL